MFPLSPRSSVIRLAIVASLLVVFAAAGCGFRPMYGERTTAGSPVTADLSAVAVDRIPDRSGQMLRNQLVRLLDPAADAESPRYTLAVSLKETVDTFAVERTGFATRGSIEMTAYYTLVEDATGNQILGGTTRAVNSFNLLDNDFSTVAATNDARSRVLDQIAYEIRNRLAAFFSNRQKAAETGAT